MKKITVTLLFVSLSATLIAQVWIPVCEGVRLKNGSDHNPSVLAMAINNAKDELYVTGDFDSLCHKCLNGFVKFTIAGVDTFSPDNSCYRSANISKMLFHSKYGYYGYDDGVIVKSNLIDTAIAIGIAKGTIYDLQFYNGNLYAAGHFSKIDWYDASSKKHSVTAYNIARFDGTSWYALGNGLTYEFNDSYVHALKVWNNELYAGGFFNDSNGHCIAHWDGTKWLDSLPGFWMTTHQFGESVEALEVYNGQLYVGGFFNRAGDSAFCSITRWDSTSSTWSSVGDGCWGPIVCLNEIDGRLWAGGYVGVIYWDNSYWHTVGFSTSGVVQAIEGYHGDIFVGGWGFSYADSLSTVYSRCFARLDPDSIAVGVTEPISETEQLSIYPNPVGDKLLVNGYLLLGAEIKIRDLLGHTLYLRKTLRQEVRSPSFGGQDARRTTEIDVSALPPGFYLLEARSGKSVTVSRFIKQ